MTATIRAAWAATQRAVAALGRGCVRAFTWTFGAAPGEVFGKINGPELARVVAAALASGGLVDGLHFVGANAGLVVTDPALGSQIAKVTALLALAVELLRRLCRGRRNRP